MSINFTIDQFKQFAPECKSPDAWYAAIMAVLSKYNLDNTLRAAAFFAEMSYESNQFNEISENLNYSAEGLLKTFPSHFNKQEAAQYAHQPEKIANRVYANRMGNGDEASGDGNKYHGRGIIQLTGHENYHAASQNIMGDELFVDDPDQLLRPDMAVETACWFWNNHNLNVLADNQNLQGITKIINGGELGEDGRVANYNTMLTLLGA